MEGICGKRLITIKEYEAENKALYICYISHFSLHIACQLTKSAGILFDMSVSTMLHSCVPESSPLSVDLPLQTADVTVCAAFSHVHHSGSTIY